MGAGSLGCRRDSRRTAVHCPRDHHGPETVLPMGLLLCHVPFLDGAISFVMFVVFYFFGRDSIGEVLFLFKLMFWFKQGYQHRLNGYGLEDIRLIDTLTWHSHGECGR